MIFCGLTLWLLRFPWFADATKDTVGAHRSWFILGFLASSAWLVTYPVGSVGRRIDTSIKKRQAKQRCIKRLHELTVEQKHVLQAYIERGSKTAEWRVPSGIITSLSSYGVIYPASPSADMFHYPYNISENAWEYLNAHPELIATPNNPRRKPGPDDWMMR